MRHNLSRASGGLRPELSCQARLFRESSLTNKGENGKSAVEYRVSVGDVGESTRLIRFCCDARCAEGRCLDATDEGGELQRD